MVYPEYQYQITYQYSIYDTKSGENCIMRKHSKIICVKDLVTEEEICQIEGEKIESNESKKLVESETKMILCRSIFEVRKILRNFGFTKKESEDLIETLLYQIKMKLIQKETRNESR